ncbi:MAG: SAM-dependent DNA methyltransferase [Thermomicrobiales bacterium]|nr:SAM-dependent DNA methyltransferase [Thermomicrobiales bacterium]
MDHAQHSQLVNFIWGIADDVLRDVYVKGKYRDVILPMVVIRRLDTVLEPTKLAVQETNTRLDAAGLVNKDAALRQAVGQSFYNTSVFTLKSLLDTPSQLEPNFRAYLDGFSPNVQEILDKFEFRNQIPRLTQHDVLGNLLEKFLDSRINLGPKPVLNADGSVKLVALDNHAMGTIFEELIRRFNEENNEEAGEHFTPRDVVQLIARLIFMPIADRIESGTYLLYDGACGTGGMLTVAEEALQELAAQQGKQVSTHLYGQEVNSETYAITTADLLLKGEGEEADNIKYGSTISADAFPVRDFDFMLSNPPYGKSWSGDLDKLGGKKGIKDPRFIVSHGDIPEMSLITRTSDGQMMFLVNKLHKMKQNTPLGSRIAEVHNGSALFTGDAGQGESNIRRWIIENDWLEAIVALPMNMFYNTGIATYIWVLTNRKPEHRQGKVQLIDATKWFRPLRKNLGKKNCELGPDDIDRIVQTYLAFEETGESKIFPNEQFGYWKVTVDRPLTLPGIDPTRAYSAKEIKSLKDSHRESVASPFMATSRDNNGDPELTHLRHSDPPHRHSEPVEESLAAATAAAAHPVIRKIHKPGTIAPDPLHGLFAHDIDGKPCIVEYEPDTDLRDTEQIPLLEPAGIAGFIEREVWPHVPDAWVDPAKTQIGYEISFTRYFYKPAPLRTLEEIRADILALEQETEGLLMEIVG